MATTGEIVLSVVLGIYRYRSGGVPLYVPPGHGVMYLLAILSSEHLHRYRRAIVITTFGVGSVAAVAMTVWFQDVFGLIGWIAVVLIAFRTRRALLIATCVAFTTVLEIAGTTIGTWEWKARILGGLPQGNPPLGVAVFYCCLDMLTLMALNGLARKRQNASCLSAMSSAVSFSSSERQAA